MYMQDRCEQDESDTCTNMSLEWTYLGIGAAGTGTEFDEEFTFWMLLVAGVCVES